jgi:hypothetical protein
MGEGGSLERLDEIFFGIKNFLGIVDKILPWHFPCAVYRNKG